MHFHLVESIMVLRSCQLHLHKLFELLSARFILDSRDKPIMDDKEDEVGFIQEDAELNLEF